MDALSFYASDRVKSLPAIGGVPLTQDRHAAQLSEFEQTLAFFLAPPPSRFPQADQPDNATLLTLNPHLNLKLIQSLHPETRLVKDQGHLRIEIPVTPQKSEQAQSTDQNLIQAVQLNSPLFSVPPQLAPQNPAPRETAFGRVVAPGSLQSLLAGQNTGAQESLLVSQSLSRLLQGQVPPAPLEAREKMHSPFNAYSHWQESA
ncbi:hypothetical protein COW36_16250 [bacterium (Candidatus Blackallbacteria) CG17_big_fil_post_rev_8_21_14_2_50_48_46]|uniref:Uncharacterized protein n=1 Tax=bacterium (Candidatus Blackallbacteria) CG17_big_fil_post_rev_8_21_14_2_50_48_46 TaxID=2014261 RepID=A0A2M7G294_9BACT|nr:MAG: hypothetical protein COW64_16720 [bacterium (Candidatus Blackallbacteria) CG18_big_fil_WC_8_21_14_2_50_49_26]PIW15687.1 MAG: hypothetical protein COW36_16250 [bacterium (Candidatus Blackallbacteria) CG17_big_fil_post_rev_8_21_14_2_50_48_46]PIW48692.1 MAG: hypothetical protein COW20_08430 [bacterium (Candidatus Blackallbacteria) CG13_big_fil_rev_8_21_14_2_50_49_14]